MTNQSSLSQTLKVPDWGHLQTGKRRGSSVGTHPNVRIRCRLGSLMTWAWTTLRRSTLLLSGERKVTDHVTGNRVHDICHLYTFWGSDLPPLTHPQDKFLFVEVIFNSLFDRRRGNDDLWVIRWAFDVHSLCLRAEEGQWRS